LTITLRLFSRAQPVRIRSELGPTSFGRLPAVVRNKVDQGVFSERGIVRPKLPHVGYAVSLEEFDRMVCEARMKRFDPTRMSRVGSKLERSI